MFTHKNGYGLESCGGAFCSGTYLVLFGQDLHVFSMKLTSQAVKVKRTAPLSDIMTLSLNKRPIKLHQKQVSMLPLVCKLPYSSAVWQAGLH
jgi:hypothetical protein